MTKQKLAKIKRLRERRTKLMDKRIETIEKFEKDIKKINEELFALLLGSK